MTFHEIPAADPYPGRTRLELSSERSLVCMGVGEEVRAILKAKKLELERREER